MKIKAFVLALGAALVGGSALAGTLDPVWVTPSGGSFTEVAVGTFTLTQTSDVTGSVLAATSINFGSGFNVPLQAVNFSFVGLAGLTDLDSSATGFHYANLAAGTYQLLATGTLSGAGFSNAAILSATVNATAVPEPATYALMLAGLGAVGFVARRRRA